jgi:hypothetical protein
MVKCDQKDAEAGRKHSLSLAEIVAGQDNRQEKEIEKGELVVDEESDGDDAEEDDDDQGRLEVPQRESFESTDQAVPLLLVFRDPYITGRSQSQPTAVIAA